MSIDFKQIRELLSAIAQNNITELTLKSEDFELTIRKDLPIVSSGVPMVASPEMTVNLPTPPAPQTAPTSPPAESPSAPPMEKKGVEITSPMVGTFYRAPAPDEDPFVSEGDRVSKGQTVCIIEAMKLMNEIEAEVTGEVIEILVENGQPVEFGQTLILIEP